MSLKDRTIQVEYSVEATVNTGNFTNVRPGYKVSVPVYEYEDPNDVRKELKALVDGWLEADVDIIHKEMNS